MPVKFLRNTFPKLFSKLEKRYLFAQYRISNKNSLFPVEESECAENSVQSATFQL